MDPRVPVGLGVHVGGTFAESHIDLAGFIAVDLLAEVTSGKSVSVFGVGVDRSHGHDGAIVLDEYGFPGSGLGELFAKIFEVLDRHAVDFLEFVVHTDTGFAGWPLGDGLLDDQGTRFAGDPQESASTYEDVCGFDFFDQGFGSGCGDIGSEELEIAKDGDLFKDLDGLVVDWGVEDFDQIHIGSSYQWSEILALEIRFDDLEAAQLWHFDDILEHLSRDPGSFEFDELDVEEPREHGQVVLGTEEAFVDDQGAFDIFELGKDREVSIGHEDTDSFEAIEGLFLHLDRNAFKDFLGEDRLLGRAFGGDTVEAFESRFALLAQGILGDES